MTAKMVKLSLKESEGGEPLHQALSHHRLEGQSGRTCIDRLFQRN